MNYKTITYICVPQKYGQGKDGVEKGPEVLEKYGIRELFQKHSQSEVKRIGLPKPKDCERTRGERGLKNIPEVRTMNYHLRDAIAEVYSKEGIVFNIGGDHSMGTGTISGVKKANPGKKVGVIWFDAHPDINTPESSPTGNIHGIPLTCCCGIGPECLNDVMTEYISTQDITYVGIRSIDDGEEEIIKKDGITHFTAQQVKECGMMKVIETIKKKYQDYDVVHLSFDIDGIDPQYIIGTGTAVPEGVSVEDSLQFLRGMKELSNLYSFDIVEFNPVIEETKTVECIMKCMRTFFGEE